jgi:uncharacterized protein (DUF1800 family)
MNRRDFFTVTTPARRSRDLGPAARPGNGAQVPSAVHARRSDTGLGQYAGPWTYTQAAHLMRRSMIGPREPEILQALADGMEATVARLLQPFEPDLTGINDWAGSDPRIIGPRDQASQEFIDYVAAIQTRRELLMRWQLRTFASSPVSIQERLVLMWSNHFTSESQTVNWAEFMYWQNRRIRRNALGNLKEFAREITKDMAMLLYLDGLKNFKTGNRSNINENYSRELMELFTMGVTDWSGTPNYTETDVAEGARALSGYFISPSATGTEYAGLESQFVASRWDSGSKTYLGRTGVWKADDVIDIIFDERADQVAKFVCEKIYRAFVYDVPDRVVIEQMATTLRGASWEIRPVIEQLLKSEHFYDVTNIGALDKSPIDYMVGMIRGLQLGVVPDFDLAARTRFSRDLTARLASLGQMIFDPPNVKGWPGGRTWISTSTLPPRQKFALDVVDGKVVGPNRVVYYTFDVNAFARQFSDYDDPDVLVDEMSRNLLNTVPSTKERATLLATLLNGSPIYEWPNLNQTQRVDRIKLFLKALVQLAKFQLM